MAERMSDDSFSATHRRHAEQRVAVFLDGKLCDSHSDATIEVIDPSSGRHRLSIPAGTAVDADRAVVSARRAFDAGLWAEGSWSLRKRVLHRLAELILAEAPSFDALDAGEMGKPVREKFASATAAAELMHFYAESVDKVTGDVHTSDRHSLVAQRRVPRGVVAAVTPWNFPTYNAVLKLAPALAAGNCVVHKPSELSSRSAMKLAQLALEAGLPAGVLNVVPGLGETVGKSLALHPDVDMLTFTGSTHVGKLMLQYAGQSNMKVVMSECGGKSPQIIFDDGLDLQGICGAIAGTVLTNQGQICSLGSRVLVQESIAAEVVRELASRLDSVVMGDALDPQTSFGPLASRRQCERVMQYIDGAIAEGAHVVAGGRRAREASGGYFVEPTLFADVAPTARVAQEEIFGPVLSVITFKDEAQAVRIANGTIYGLMAYVWTADLTTGMRVAKNIRSSVIVNAGVPKGEGAGHAASFEPARQSGIGVEGGLAGLESYLRRQLLCFNHA